jgi:hypothetical protein
MSALAGFGRRIPTFFVYAPPGKAGGGFLGDVSGRRMLLIACGASLVEALRRGIIAYGRPDHEHVLVVTDPAGNVVIGSPPSMGDSTSPDSRCREACDQAQVGVSALHRRIGESRQAMADSRRLLASMKLDRAAYAQARAARRRGKT